VIGETASHYRVIERLGQGGMGEVYLAEDTRLHRRVALKMLRADLHCDAQARARLLREARAASALNHPNIAVVYDVDDVERDERRVGFIAMEYVPGRTLCDWARGRDLDLDAVLDVAGQIADALGEAHARGIVHRDVKPSNVMVTESGRAKVLDFGLADRRVLPGEADSTWTRPPGEAPGTLMGTLAYMAPEQARDEPVDGRADVFSLGAMLYEVLAGHPPFQGRNAVEVLDALLNRDPPPFTPRASDPRAAALETVVRRMLAKDRRRRHADMREVTDELRAVRLGEAVRVSSEPAPGVAVLSFVSITGRGEDDWLGTGVAETLAAELRAAPGLSLLGRERVAETLRTLGAEAQPADEALALRVGRELGARYVLSGALQRAGEAVRVTARATDVPSGATLRTVKLDGRLGQIFELQDRIARELLGALRPEPAPAERAAEPTRVIEAYEALSRGVLNLRAESYESLDRAAFLFARAAALDPGYAQAHLELGSTLATKADFLALPELHERALECFHAALALRPGLVRAWRETGASLVALCREEEGLGAIRRALELDPEDAGAIGSMGRALFLGRADFEEAARWFEHALRRNPQGGWWALQLAHCRALLRDFARGESAARRAVALQEEFLSGHEGVPIVGAHMRLGHLAALQGRHDEALACFEREATFLERVDHALRQRIQIELSLRTGSALRRVRLGADEPFTRYYAAGVHALRGEADAALAALETCAREKPRFTLARARLEPEWDALRDHPRFRALVGGSPS
jgi:TolB-like protein/predicted Ser/Thr protein kinase